MRRIALLLATTVSAVTLTACSTAPDVTACKAAMSQQLDDGMAAGDNATPGTRPTACNGVDDTTLNKIATDLLRDKFNEALSAPLGDSSW